MTWRKQFLAAMDELVPWDDFAKWAQPAAAPCNSPGCTLGSMLRIVMMQSWFGYDVCEMHRALHRWAELREFAGLPDIRHVPQVGALRSCSRRLERLGVISRMVAAGQGAAQ